MAITQDDVHVVFLRGIIFDDMAAVAKLDIDISLLTKNNDNEMSKFSNKGAEVTAPIWDGNNGDGWNVITEYQG